MNPYGFTEEDEARTDPQVMKAILEKDAIEQALKQEDLRRQAEMDRQVNAQKALVEHSAQVQSQAQEQALAQAARYQPTQVDMGLPQQIPGGEMPPPPGVFQTGPQPTPQGPGMMERIATWMGAPENRMKMNGIAQALTGLGAAMPRASYNKALLHQNFVQE